MPHNPNRLDLILGDDNTIVRAYWDSVTRIIDEPSPLSGRISGSPSMQPVVWSRVTGLTWLHAMVLVFADLSLCASGSAQLVGAPPGQPSGIGLLKLGGAAALDRIAYAVDAAESSHGADARMWRLDLDGPQGPMQVTAAAAADVGGGDRFDEQQNRAIGRAYLAQMYRRYGSWFEAVAAYNWGPGKMDSWISSGRPFDKIPAGVEHYRIRVMLGSGFGPSRLARVNDRSRQRAADPHNGRAAVELLYPAIISSSELALR
jgi:Transglycosylase SLT domain